MRPPNGTPAARSAAISPARTAGSRSTRAAWSRGGLPSGRPERSGSWRGTDFCLSARGDIVCRTLDPDDPPWRIGIEDPADIDGTAAYARGEDAARWLQTRHGRTGLVIWADGSTSPVRGPAEG